MKYTMRFFGTILFLLMVATSGKAQKIDSLRTQKDKATNLSEVKIITAKKIFYNKNGNIKIDVEHSVLSSISNPLNLIAKLPAVLVSADREKLSIVGKGEPIGQPEEYEV